MIRGDADVLIDAVIELSLELYHMEKGKATHAEFEAKRKERNDVWDRMADAMCELKDADLRATQQLLAWIDSQLGREFHKRDLVNGKIESLMNLQLELFGRKARIEQEIADDS